MSLAWIDNVLAEGGEFRRAAECLAEGKRPAWIEGLASTARLATLAYLARTTERMLLLVVADEEQAERAVSDFEALGFSAESIGLYPDGGAALDDFLPEGRLLASSEAPERRALVRRRLGVLAGLAEGRLRVVVAPITAALRVTLGPIRDARLELRRGDEHSPQDLLATLVGYGYERVELVSEPGQLALRGGVLDVYPATGAAPARLDFFGDEIETLREFDPATQRSYQDTDALILLPARERLDTDGGRATLLEHLPPGALIALDEPNHLKTRVDEHQERMARHHHADAGAAPPSAETIALDDFRERLAPFRLLLLTLLTQSPPWLRAIATDAERFAINSGVLEAASGDIPELAGRIKSWLGGSHCVAVASDQPQRVAELLAEQEVPATSAAQGGPHGERVVRTHHARLSMGFRLPALRFVLLTDAEIFPSARNRPRSRPLGPRFKQGRPILSLMELHPGDLVVHEVHGIGRYVGLERRVSRDVEREFIRIDYRGTDRLFVPSEQLDRVQKYIGGDDSPPTIHRLGGGEWARTKSRVRARVREMATELLKLYASRQAAEGHRFSPDTVWQQELASSFPYEETRDQLQAIGDVGGDMESPQVMDRLVCGDVGYGKTEVAVRAAFKAVTDGRQVAVLVPTTVLAQQHFNTFSERLAAFPVRIELLSRFRTPQEQKQVVADVKGGVVDIVIGTHRLLSKDVSFHELGLLIIDEEHRFGVAHKERLKQLKTCVDALTLTATPIPRTLHMSLTGIRDMSVIEEPPEGRLAVRTYCLEADRQVMREAILRELDRGGQIYYVHNKVQNIHREAARLRELAPQARVRIGHGQMSASELEAVMLDFYEGQYDILLCTTIIESGLDIPNVNTIIINDADHFGLSQLHQLRGRVGRGSRQAYCFLLTKPYKQLTEAAEKRLSALREFTDLGAGFQIAMRDLEIRGAGNLLGAEQHGNIAAVGFDLYCQMLEEEVKALQGEPPDERLLPAVSLPVPTLIPEGYVPTEGLRIACYRKIAACKTELDVDGVQAELQDRFGDPPASVWNLLRIIRLRIRCVGAGVARIEADARQATLWLAGKLDRIAVRDLHREFRRARLLPDRVVLHYDGPALRPVEELVDALQRFGGKSAAEAVQKQLRAAEHLEAATGQSR